MTYNTLMENLTLLPLRDQCLALAEKWAVEDYGASVDRLDPDDLEFRLQFLDADGGNMNEVALAIAALAHFFN